MGRMRDKIAAALARVAFVGALLAGCGLPITRDYITSIKLHRCMAFAARALGSLA